MRILAVGDIVGKPGREYVYNDLGRIKNKYNIDFVIANGENAASSNGITPEIADRLVLSGVDVITMGNHTFGTNTAGKALEENERLIRPLNYPPEYEGRGYVVQDLGYASVAVINLLGRTNMTPANCPFHAVEKAVEELRDKADIVLVDMHAEATSEKIAMGHFLDGKVQAVFGTHTHVQTADEQILAGGTGYISDLGMTGIMDSVLGVKKDIIVKFFYNAGKRYRFEKAEEGEVWFNGCVFEIDNRTKQVTGIERLRFSHID